MLFDVSEYVPTERGQSDHLLFSMAGRLLGAERDLGRKSTAEERAAIFDAWWTDARDNVDPAFDRYAYFSKWNSACKNRKRCHDETALDEAWRAATTEPLPPEALALPEAAEELRRLVALCYQLQKKQHPAPFFLTSRDAGKRINTPYRTIAHWLVALSVESPHQVLEKVSSGSQAKRLANEYRYLCRSNV